MLIPGSFLPSDWSHVDEVEDTHKPCAKCGWFSEFTVLVGEDRYCLDHADEAAAKEAA